MTNPNINDAELRQIAWNQLDQRITHGTNPEQVHGILQYKQNEVPENVVNQYRDKIINFIEKHPNRLSMPCDGNCYQHADGVVLYCYMSLKEELKRG